VGWGLSDGIGMVVHFSIAKERRVGGGCKTFPYTSITCSPYIENHN
jgi:hypothetical protein